MRYLRIILAAIVFATILYSCNKDLNVNADWKAITVVYGLLDQTQDTTFIKITKAFLGPGDAMQFAKVPDSSMYPDKLDVKLEAWNGNTQVNVYTLDTITIHTKQAGDSIFYYPDQLVYYYPTGHLSQDLTYKLKITHKKSGVMDSAVTKLIHAFEITMPDPFMKRVEYVPGHNFDVNFEQAYGGKRYQLVIRFHYRENFSATDTVWKHVDWMVFNNMQVTNPEFDTTQMVTEIQKSFSSEGFYNILSLTIKDDIAHPVESRTIGTVDYIFSVASEDLNTYIEVYEPSLAIVQERPIFSNIYNGVGLFSSRYINAINQIDLGPQTHIQLKTNPKTVNLKFVD
jgi:hypothetical protein